MAPKVGKQKREGKLPVGRPTTYTPELGEAICARLAQGMTVRQACEGLGCDRTTVFGWAHAIPAFTTMYARARELQLNAIEDELTEIADDGKNDWMEIESRSGNKYTKINDEAVRRSQIRLEARYRILAARRPETYGKRLDVTSGGKALGQLGAAMIALAQEQEPAATEIAPVAH